MNIGNKIADERKKQNLTQEQLAEMMEVTRQTVSRWESNLAYPEMEKMVKLAAIFGVSCDYLLNDDYREAEASLGASGQMRNPVTRLLADALGKRVKLQLADDDDVEIYNKVCTITEFDGMWMNVEYKKGKGMESKLVPISNVTSIKFVKEEK